VAHAKVSRRPVARSLSRGRAQRAWRVRAATSVKLGPYRRRRRDLGRTGQSYSLRAGRGIAAGTLDI